MQQNEIKKFVKLISGMSPPNENSINIYQGNSYEAKLRRKNLLAYLTKMFELEPKTILIGEAPGIHGCGKTGIPFTDEFAIATEQFFANGDFGNMGLDHERSAAVIWNVIRNKKEMPFMWNIYPFQPLSSTKSKRSNMPTNRTPTGEEIEIGRDIFMELLYIYKFENFYAIGKKAFDALVEVIPETKYIRHPSHGGMKECAEALNELL